MQATERKQNELLKGSVSLAEYNLKGYETAYALRGEELDKMSIKLARARQNERRNRTKIIQLSRESKDAKDKVAMLEHYLQQANTPLANADYMAIKQAVLDKKPHAVEQYAKFLSDAKKCINATCPGAFQIITNRDPVVR